VSFLCLSHFGWEANSAAIPKVRRSRSARSCRACGASPVVSFFVRRRQFLLVGIDHEHGQQLRGFGLARVFTDAVPVTGHLGEALPGAIRNDRPIIGFASSCFGFYLVGTSTGAPLSFTKNTTNFAGLVWLAFRPTT